MWIARILYLVLLWFKLGRTPLFFAIRGGYSDCVLLLLKNFANPWSTHKNTYDAYLDRLTEKVREAYRLSKRVIIHLI